MKTKQIFLTLSLVMVSLYTYSQGISASAHDFSSATWRTDGSNEICNTCHTPHNSTVLPDSPLWDHAVTGQTFAVYSSTTLNATDLSDPTGVSRLCLSCHDGTVALDSYAGATGITMIQTERAGAQVGAGSTLEAEHPISFTYDATLASTDGGLYDPTTQTSGLAGGGTIDDDLLFAGSVECSSCHDVHNSSGAAMLLVKSNASSALCMTCHNK